MKEVKILHITDLHLNDISVNSEEHLGEGIFESYIQLMCQQISNQYDNIDAVIITGDFVDRGKIENFPHAQKVVQAIHTYLGTNDSKVGVCIGNHDIKCEFNDSKIISEDKSDYNSFAQRFSNNLNNLFTSERFNISKIGPHILFLSLDSTLRRGLENIPGIISPDEFNLIVQQIKKARSTDTQLLIIATHFPCVHFYDYPYPPEKGWHDSHFWSSGEHLRARINKEFKDIKILWLFGDTHQPGFMQSDSNLYVMTGRIGTTTKSKEPSVLPRHAHIIHFKNNNEVKISSLIHAPKSHPDESQGGTWKFIDKDTFQTPTLQPDLIYNKKSDQHEFENSIIQNIFHRDLYNLGRFEVHEDEVSLGWVSINQLLNQRDILAPIIKNSIDWILQIGVYSDKMVLIGIDFWGAIIASSLSVSLGCRNYCFASRGDSKYHTFNLILNDKKCNDIIGDTDSVIFISDVIASGRTIHKFFLHFTKNCPENCIPKISSISVISDLKQEKRVNLNFLHSFGTFCGNLRIPIFKEEDLPPKEVMPLKSFLK